MGDETQCPASWLFGMNGNVFLVFAFGLPFLEDEELMEIHEKIAESPDGEFEGVTVHDILTLIDDVDELFFRAVEMGKDISEYLPYVSDEGFHKLIEGCVNDKYDVNLDDIYPFLPEEELKLLLKKLLNK